ncbi:HNH endonuclease [Candidatus Poriferisodalis sp.]|uniref:HNH endonuclease n=1 Tax=Candidatus Poriferisodalis sp. TaxID=3101277 RepID=UPI003B0130AF
MSKMMNLDGSRVNGAKPEVQLFVALSANKDQYYRLYLVALRAARQMGVNDQQLPDFLQYEQWSQLDLEELDDLRSLKHVDEARYQEIIEEDAVKLRAQKLRLGQVLSAAETTQIVQHRARIGQRAFRVDVLRNFDYTCGFCGMAPRSLSGNPLLVASHIKPWADSTNRERRDPHNGIAACPIHDAAFDKGLITVNGGLRVHRSRKLRQSILIDVGVEHNFGDSLADTLLVPPGTASPRGSYLSWHQQHVYQDTLP